MRLGRRPHLHNKEQNNSQVPHPGKATRKIAVPGKDTPHTMVSVMVTVRSIKGSFFLLQALFPRQDISRIGWTTNVLPVDDITMHLCPVLGVAVQATFRRHLTQPSATDCSTTPHRNYDKSTSEIIVII